MEKNWDFGEIRQLARVNFGRTDIRQLERVTCDFFWDLSTHTHEFVLAGIRQLVRMTYDVAEIRHVVRDFKFYWDLWSRTSEFRSYWVRQIVRVTFDFTEIR